LGAVTGLGFVADELLPELAGRVADITALAYLDGFSDGSEAGDDESSVDPERAEAAQGRAALASEAVAETSANLNSIRQEAIAHAATIWKAFSALCETVELDVDEDLALRGSGELAALADVATIPRVVATYQDILEQIQGTHEKRQKALESDLSPRNY